MSSSVLIRSKGSEGQRDYATDDLHVNHESKEAPVRVVEICKSIHPGLALTGTNREYDVYTPGKLSNLTFLPFRDRLDPVEHAAVETTYVAREERNQEEQVQFY